LAVGSSDRDAAAQSGQNGSSGLIRHSMQSSRRRSRSSISPPNLGGIANIEGPLWWKEGGYLLFRGNDLKRWKYAPGQGISVFKENT